MTSGAFDRGGLLDTPIAEGLRADVAIILAAGGSRRMGSPKGLLRLDGRPLIEHHLRALRPAARALRVVLGAEAERYLAAFGALAPCDLSPSIVLNPDWATTGPRESLQRALADLPADATALLTPVDVAPAPATALAALLSGGAPAVPTWEGLPGHPVWVRVGETREALRQGTLQQALTQARRAPVDWPDLALNLNTPEDWAAYVRRARGPG